jgi:hypothetical protein
LFDDLAQAIGDRDEDEYFLGTLVLMRDEDERPAVIDGQQRLATISILIAAIRDWFFEDGDAGRATEIGGTYLYKKDLKSLEPEARIYLNTDDRKYFESRIISLPDDKKRKVKAEKPSQKRIEKAAQLAKAQVEKIAALGSTSTADDRLLSWIKYLHENVRVVAIFVPGEQNAYTLFETLNDRGLELSKSDLVKNHLFGRAGDRLDEVQQCWDEMIGVLQSVGNDEIAATFMRHYWMSKYSTVRKPHLYREVREKIKSRQKVIDFSSELAAESQAYAAILSAEPKFWKPYGVTTRDHIATLRELGVEQIRPLLLSIVRHFDTRSVRQAVHLSVCWCVRFLIAGGGGGGVLEGSYSKCAIAVSDGSIKTVQQLAKAMHGVVPQDEEFRASFATATVSKTHLARYYLRAIEDRLAEGPLPETVANPNPDAVNLEHILPQRPSKAWSHIPREDAEALYRRLGNMAIMAAATNVQIGNQSFLVKKKVFRKSPFEFTRAVYNCRRWTAKEIESRQKKLADVAVKTWPLKVW